MNGVTWLQQHSWTPRTDRQRTEFICPDPGSNRGIMYKGELGQRVGLEEGTGESVIPPDPTQVVQRISG
jgi:hypothetical protein